MCFFCEFPIHFKISNAWLKVACISKYSHVWPSMGCKYFDNVYEKGYVSFLSEDFLISWVYDYLFGGNRPRMLLRMEISSI